MGTRSIVLVKKSDSKGKVTVHRLYKHWDGYPTENLKMIQQAIDTCTKLAHDSFLEALPIFVKSCESYYERENMVEETFHSDTFDPEMLGHQSDLEWIYTVDLDAKQVKVFGGGYTGNPPQYAYQNGTVNPLDYANALIESYRDKERERIQENINGILALGFKLN